MSKGVSKVKNASRELVLVTNGADEWPAREQYAVCTEALGKPGTRQIPAESLLMITDVLPGPPGLRDVLVAYVPPDDLKVMATIQVWEGLLRPTRPVVVAPSLGRIDDKDIFVH